MLGDALERSMTVTPAHFKASRYDRLAGFLRDDPQNLGLIAEAVAAAMDEGRLTQAAKLVERHADIAPPPPSLINALGLIALEEGRFQDAVNVFAALISMGSDDARARFNLAWARSMAGDQDGALEALDDATLEAVPAAAALKVRSFHRLGRLHEAIAVGADLADERNDDADLMGALGLVALDAEDMGRARSWAMRAGENHEGLSTLGFLALAENDIEAAAAAFDAALAVYPDSARSLLGKGMVLLSKGDAGAAGPIDRGAEIFDDHVGSWIAAGWAHCLAANHAVSRDRFERALRLDDNFAESHGALAVLDVIDGRIESARRRARTALRLDRSSLAGALAQSLLLIHDGDPEGSTRIRQAALNTPVGVDGQTIVQAMVGLGFRARG